MKIIIEVGSTNTKIDLFDGKEVKHLATENIEFKRNYKKENRLDTKDVQKLIEVVKEYTQKYNKEPDTKTIANALGMTQKNVQETLDSTKDTISINAAVGDDEDDATLEDLIEDKKSLSPEKIAIQELTKDIINKMLGTLDKREKEVIEMRFGLNGYTARTLEDCSKHFKVTRERIRQIENEALKKLRNPIRANKLKELL